MARDLTTYWYLQAARVTSHARPQPALTFEQLLDTSGEFSRRLRRTEAWLRGYISFSDYCQLEGLDPAERRASLEALGIDVPEWMERPKPRGTA